MGLKNLLAQKKAVIVKQWFGRVIETYPPDTTKFLKRQKDPFANPVGRTIYHGLETLLEQLVKGIDHKALESCLDPIIRIRAIQNFSPSQAVGFIFFLKEVIRTSLYKKIAQEQLDDELLSFETQIDELSLIAFNLYMKCREKIYEIKANEMKNRTFKAFERAGLVKEIPENDPVPGPIITGPIINFRKEASNDT
jgi:hypothetical protein